MNRNKLPTLHSDPISSTNAGIGCSILHRIEQINQKRMNNAQRLADLIKEKKGMQIPQPAAGGVSVLLRFPITVPDKAAADSMYNLLSRAGIGVSRSYQRSLPQLFPDQLSAEPMKYPGAEHLANCLLTLPTHPFLKDDDFARMQSIFDDCD